jgi:ribosomal protein S18 acetylase RimI-like enzyme
VCLIRKATPKDALGISIVNTYTWKTTYFGLMPDILIDSRIDALKSRAEKCKSDIEQNDNFIVAVVDDTVIGFCLYGPSRNEDYKASGEIYALYVLKGYQGENIGKRLFIAGKNELIDRGYSSIIINCLKENPSLGFYEHMGGKIVGERHDCTNSQNLSEDILYFKI